MSHSATIYETRQEDFSSGDRMKVNLDLKCALIKRFGSQIAAARELGIRESKLSYIIRGHAEPSERERKAFEGALGRSMARRVLNDPS